MGLATFAAFLFFGTMLFFTGRLLAPRGVLAQGVALAATLVAGAFFCACHHQDAFSGLDTACYAMLADDLRAGVPLAGDDALYSSVPSGIAEAFLFRPRFVAGSPSLRMTRDRAREVRERPAGGFSFRPFFMPAHSLAAAGSRLGRCFMPAAGALFVAVLLLAAARSGGSAALLPAAAALAATAYPAWFFRGDYAEGAASILVLSALVSHLAKPYRGTFAFLLAGFAATLAMSFHLTAILLAGPIALLIFFDAPSGRCRLSLLAGLLAGFAPLWLTTRFICAPYGDWTRLAMLRAIAVSATEHAAMAGALAVLAALCAVGTALACSQALRFRAARFVRAVPFAAWVALAILPAILLSAAPGDTGAKFRFAIAFGAKSLRAPVLILAAILLAALVRAPRRLVLLSVLFAWGACVFLLVFGQESFATRSPATGIWGYRRLLPPVLAFASVFAVTAGRSAATLRRSGWRRFTAAALVVAALANPVRSPAAYFAVEGEGSFIPIDGFGADDFVSEMRREIDSLGADLVVFDYFPHHVPFAAEGRPVLGLAPHAYGRWGEVADWLAEKAKGGKTWFASSYELPETEEGFAFAEMRSFQMNRRIVKSKSFLDAQIARDVSVVSLARAVPIGASADGPAPQSQSLAFDGSPVALRGPWAKAGRGGMWSREGSGFVAPFPQPGKAALVEFDLEWTPPSGGPQSQMLRIDYPGNPYMALMKVEAGRHTLKIEFVSEKPLPAAGIYTVSAPRPFNPAEFGMKGYPEDLGVIFRGVRVSLREQAAGK